MMEYKNSNFYSWVFFVLWPFGSFAMALKNVFFKHNQKIILAFSFLYGYSVFLSSGDILRYEQSFYDVILFDWDYYVYLIQNRHNMTEMDTYSNSAIIFQPDYFALSLQFFVSRFTENPRWFWALLSLIYTYLTLNFLNIFYQEVNWIKKFYLQKIFLIGLIMIVPFFVGVTGVRFWPALFLFTSYAILFLNTKRLKYLIIASLSILIHFSFLLPVALLVLVFFMPKSKYFYKLLVTVGLIYMLVGTISSSLGFISSVSSNMDETSVSNRSEAYSSEDFLAARNDKELQTNWYVRYNTNFVLYFFILIGVLDVLGFLKFKENNFLYNTYPLFLIFLILLMITKDLGSISRFRYVFYLLLLGRYLILIGLQPNNKKLKLIAICFMPILFLHIIVSFRSGFYTVDPLLLVNNSVLSFFMHSDISLSEFLIGH